MKKLLVIFICIILFLSACNSIDEFPDDPELSQLSGILTEQKNGDNYSGTHLLTDDSAQKFALRSVAINLSDAKYLNNKIQIYSVYDSEEDVYSVTGVTVLEVLNDLKKDDSIIQTYKNSDFGIQLKYYDDWLIDETDTKILFTSPDNDSVSILQTPFSYQASVFDSEQNDTPLNNYAATNFPEFGDVSSFYQKIGLDGLDALFIENEYGVQDYYLYRNGFIYHIEFVPSDVNGAKALRQFNEMINDFRFIGFTVEETPSEDFVSPEEGVMEEINLDDSNFTFFDSLPYHFSAKYPASWYYAGKSGSSANVRHHYGFSDESVGDENELYFLEVFSGQAPMGENVNINGRDVTKIVNGENIEYYINVSDQLFKVSGTSDVDDYMKVTVSSIMDIVVDEEL